MELRKRRAGPIRERLKAWLEKQLSRQLPKSPIGVAIRYTLGQWDALGVFLTDAAVPLDNNASERSLRRIAIGRKNYLFVGDLASGESLAGLYSLVATCESRGINPFDYLTDVLERVHTHPARALRGARSRDRERRACYQGAAPIAAASILGSSGCG